MHPRIGGSLWLLVGCLMLACGAPLSWAGEPELNPATAAAPSSAMSPWLEDLPPERQRTVQRAIEGARSHIWWNKPRLIESLALRETQRQAMDRALQAFLAETLTYKDRPLPTNPFRRGLIDGDFTKAKQGLEELGERAKVRGMKEGEMMLRVLEQLTPEQLETFRTRHRRLLSRSWVMVVSSPGPRGGGTDNRGRGGAAVPSSEGASG